MHTHTNIFSIKIISLFFLSRNNYISPDRCYEFERMHFDEWRFLLSRDWCAGKKLEFLRRRVVYRVAKNSSRWEEELPLAGWKINVDHRITATSAYLPRHHLSLTRLIVRRKREFGILTKCTIVAKHEKSNVAFTSIDILTASVAARGLGHGSLF